MHSILKIVFLEIQNKAIRPVLSGPVTFTLVDQDKLQFSNFQTQINVATAWSSAKLALLNNTGYV